MSADPIYLDFNATTPIDPEVIEAMLPYLRDHFGNPSSGHVYGARVKKALETAREQVAELIHAEADEIVFTGSGTEANNITILGTACANERKERMLHSAIEHPSVANPCRFLTFKGWTVSTLPVDSHGIVALDAAMDRLKGGAVLLSVMHANNETGAVQPIRELSELAHAQGILMHSDAAQSLGKLPIDVKQLQVDALTLVGHKMYAPKGVGALYIRRGAPIAPINFGGGQERGIRPGTENVALIAAFGKACSLAQERLENDAQRILRLKKRLWSKLQNGVPGIALNSPPDRCLPNSLNVSFPGVTGSAILRGSPTVAASTGSACHEGAESPSSVLTAMGLGRERALGAVRLSLGRTTSESDVDTASEALIAAWKRLSA